MTFTVASCQKDNNPTKQTLNASKPVYQPPQVNDMLAYLKNFKQKIQCRGDEETMTLDEAAWHLSSLANYDYGDVRSEVSDFHYDTLYSQIVVNNGTVSLTDMIFDGVIRIMIQVAFQHFFCCFGGEPYRFVYLAMPLSHGAVPKAYLPVGIPAAVTDPVTAIIR